MKNTNVSNNSIQQKAIILLLSAVIVKIIGALFKIPLSSNYFLGDLGFGYFSCAYDFFTPLYTLSISGFPVAISKIIAEYVAKKDFEKVKNVFVFFRKSLLILGVLLSLFIALLMVPLFKIYVGSGLDLYSFSAIIPAIIFCFIASVYRGYFEGFGNMIPAAISNIIEALCKLVLGLLFAFIVLKISSNFALAAAAALFGITLGNIFSVFYLNYVYKCNVCYTNKTKTEKFDNSNVIIGKNIIFIAIPIVLASLSVNIVTLIDAITVRFQLTEVIKTQNNIFYNMFSPLLLEYNSITKETILIESLPTLLYGIRSKAYTLYNLVPTLTVTIGISAVPVLTSKYFTKEDEALRKEINSSIKISCLISAPIAFGFVFIGKNIFTLLYSKSLSSMLGGKILSLYGIAAFFASISVVLICILQAVNKQKNALVNVCIGIFVKVILNFLLTSVPVINIYGCVLSTVFAFITVFLLNLFYLISVIKIDIKNSLVKPSIASLFCGITALLITKTGESRFITILSIFLGGIVYFIALYFLKALKSEDILGLPMGNKLLKLCKKLKIQQ